MLLLALFAAAGSSFDLLKLFFGNRYIYRNHAFPLKPAQAMYSRGKYAYKHGHYGQNLIDQVNGLILGDLGVMITYFLLQLSFGHHHGGYERPLDNYVEDPTPVAVHHPAPDYHRTPKKLVFRF